MHHVAGRRINKENIFNGEMEKSTVTYTVDRKGYHLFIEKVPAYVCSQCGEKYFDEKEVKAIQNMLKSFEENLKKVLMVA